MAACQRVLIISESSRLVVPCLDCLPTQASPACCSFPSQPKNLVKKQPKRDNNQGQLKWSSYLAMRLLEAPKSTHLTPEEGTAEEIITNYSAVIIFHRFREGNVNQKHRSCRAASLAVRLDVFIGLAEIQVALNTPFGKNTLIRSFNLANRPCEKPTRQKTGVPPACPRKPHRAAPAGWHGAHPHASTTERPGHRQGFESSAPQTKNLPGITTRQRDRLFFFK